MSEAGFRFEKMEIWQRATDVSSALFDLADALDKRKYFRFGEQLRAATLSITNNIAEGSGSDSDDDFSNFLKFSRRSLYEVANMLMLFAHKGYLNEAEINPLLAELQEQSKMILAFRRSLKLKRSK
jgi:four helix bundle protein